MLCFDVSHNGKRLARGGIRKGVLSVMVTWVSRKEHVEPDRLGQDEAVPGLDCSLGGLNTARPALAEHVDWVKLRSIRLGDEISVRVTRASRADPPTRRETSSSRRRRRRGREVMVCSFCRKERPTAVVGQPPRFLLGVQVAICWQCLALAAALFEYRAVAVLHLTAARLMPCSFCGHRKRARLVEAVGSTICSGCVGAVYGAEQAG